LHLPLAQVLERNLLLTRAVVPPDFAYPRINETSVPVSADQRRVGVEPPGAFAGVVGKHGHRVVLEGAQIGNYQLAFGVLLPEFPMEDSGDERIFRFGLAV